MEKTNNQKYWKLFLVWGWDINSPKYSLIEKRILAEPNKDHIKVWMILISQWDNINYYTPKIKHFLDKHAKTIWVKVEMEVIDTKILKNDNLRQEKLKTCDIIYFSWWDPIIFQNVVSKKLFIKTIDENIDKIIVWRSAWMLVFFEKYITKNNLGAKAKDIVIDWYWIFPYIWCAHFIQKNRKIILKNTVNKLKLDWIWVDENSGIIISFNEKDKILFTHEWNNWIYIIKNNWDIIKY